MAEVPLATLLSWAWIAFAIEADNTVEAAGSDRVGRLFRISIATWSNGLRCIGEEGTTVGELQAQARAGCNIGGLERWGWITVGDPGAGRRDGYGTHRGVKGDTVLRPTRAGSYARRLWPQAVADVEQRWRARFGGGAVIAMGTGFLGRKKLAELRPGRLITLTARGRAALEDYRARAVRRDDQRLRACLEAIMSQREALAEGLVPPEGGWRAGKPYLAQTQCMLADPTSALPWHPMVLHRGGWPDGS